MAEFPNTETRTLRRIALLVLRARQDEDDRRLTERLGKIVTVLDHMKRDIAIGSPASEEDVASLALLVGRLPNTGARIFSADDVVRRSALLELQDLVSELRKARPANH